MYKYTTSLHICYYVETSLFASLVESQKGIKCWSKLFRWEPEGRYHCTKSMVIVPFWFITKQHYWPSDSQLKIRRMLDTWMHNYVHISFRKNHRIKVPRNVCLWVKCKRMAFSSPWFAQHGNNRGWLFNYTNLKWIWKRLVWKHNLALESNIHICSAT